MRWAGRGRAIATVGLPGLLGLFSLVCAPIAVAAMSTSSNSTGSGGGAAPAAALAAANIGKSAGSCANQPSVNSLGGAAFDGSCSGYNGKPEYWCADFAMWAWQNTGFYSVGLTAAAGSFYVYGQNNGSLHTAASYVPQPGDAVVYDYAGNGSADHVAIVTAVNADGSVVTANGDWNGIHGGTEAAFATSSAVVSVTIPAGQRAVGTIPSTVDPADHYQISAYVSPVTTAGGGGIIQTHPSLGNPFSPTSLCGTGYGVIDSHDLGSAVVYLLYNSSSGNNCVAMLADSPAAPVAMSATLTVQGGGSAADSGSYPNYAGPVVEHAPGSCVEWGGSYQDASWTSGWSHCG